jgi:hypothetical protein
VKYRPLLLDVGGLSACCTDHALESFAKAISGEDGDAHDIWEPHHSPFVSRLIELFTQRGLLRIQAVAEQLDLWLAGAKHQPHPEAPLARPVGLLARWTPQEATLVRLYLENLPLAAFTLDDWMLVVDHLVQTYLPAGEMLSEAEWLATRSTIMGRVQANMAVSAAQADVLIGALPLTVAAASSSFKFGDAFNATMDFARARCCENVVALTDASRHALRSVILQHQAQVAAGGSNPQIRQALASQLLDKFGTWNRDWRRIAVTEAGENANQGMLASLKPGARVRRIEQYRGACPYCKKIDGVVMGVADPADPEKDGTKQVWVGKTNIGRSSAPRKRVGSVLVERLPSELWWIPAGTVHPHCRGTWHAMPDAKPTDDPDFQAWLDKHLHGIRKQ